ncbi:MAG TPA: TetR/AcrR family transcriptional regulator [Thermoanaerobaculia bacterium]|nr:TetR/AcrR family transcriptional regulator [Thermoanaerobaculia bacterium]
MRAIAIREDVRDLILDASERLLSRFGYAKMTMDDLAREVGIGKGTLYLHFPSKEEVVLSRLDRLIDRLTEELSAIAASDRDPAEKLREMLITRVLFRFDAARAYAESIDEMLAAIRPGLLARRERHFAREAGVFAQLLDDAKRAGVFVFRDAGNTAQSLLLATNSLLPSSLTVKQLGHRGSVEAKVSNIAALLINGLRRKS